METMEELEIEKTEVKEQPKQKLKVRALFVEIDYNECSDADQDNYYRNGKIPMPFKEGVECLSEWLDLDEKIPDIITNTDNTIEEDYFQALVKFINDIKRQRELVEKQKEHLWEVQHRINSMQKRLKQRKDPSFNDRIKKLEDKKIWSKIHKLNDSLEYPRFTYTNQSRIENISSIELELDNPTEIVQCSEFDIPLFKELALKSELYATPWDEEPRDAYFANYLAEDCEKGREYSKDFQYFECPGCDRWICEQNPANGYITQYRFKEEEQICIQCLQKEYIQGVYDPLEFGEFKSNPSDEEKRDLVKFEIKYRKEFNCNKNEVETTEYYKPKTSTSHPAMFYNHNELESNNWESSSYYGYNASETSVTKRALELMSEGYYVLVDIDAIGLGCGADVTFYIKKIPDEYQIKQNNIEQEKIEV